MGSLESLNRTIKGTKRLRESGEQKYQSNRNRSDKSIMRRKIKY